jgi:hypothetical protein
MLAAGYLFKDNMFSLDKAQNFYWSKMLLTVIDEDKISKTIENFNLIEINWKIVKEFFLEAQVYYNKKRKVNATNPLDTPTLDSQYIYGIINDKIETKVELYPYELFESDSKMIKKIDNNKPTIRIGNKDKQFVTSYYMKDNLVLPLLDKSEFPNVLNGNECNTWNIFGYAISADKKGEKLKSPNSYVAQFWAY